MVEDSCHLPFRVNAGIGLADLDRNTIARQFRGRKAVGIQGGAIAEDFEKHLPGVSRPFSRRGVLEGLQVHFILRLESELYSRESAGCGLLPYS